MVYATGDKVGPRRLRVGMVGGGRNAFIGAVHRMALRLDDRAELVAGALSSDPENARLSGLDIGIAEGRAYSDYTRMAEAEAKRPDGSERPNYAGMRKQEIAAAIENAADVKTLDEIEEDLQRIGAMENGRMRSRIRELKKDPKALPAVGRVFSKPSKE